MTKTLSQLRGYREHLSQKIEIDSVIGKELTIHSVTPMTGDMGDYVSMKVQIPGDDQMYTLSTGASQIVDMMTSVPDVMDFPITATIRKAGRAYFIE